MAPRVPQTYANHSRFVPAYHGGVFWIFGLNFFWSLYRLVTRFSADSIAAFLLAIGFLILVFYTRMFPLTVQDRLIRLEMTLRLQRLLPEDLRGRIGEFSVGQLIALRFASDDELPALCRRVLDEKLSSRKVIKKLIEVWTPDYLRV
jgi:hypothetical protein